MALSERLNLNPDNVPNIKLGLHAAQVVLALVIFILEIIVFRAEDSKLNGNNGWPFGLCFLSIPAWVYLALAPRYERTRRAANANVMLVVDAIFTIFWLSAFASQAAYNTANSCGKACKVSKAVVGIAFFETFAWILSTLVSTYTLRYYQQNGDLPGYEKMGSHQNIDPDKAAFSMAPHDEEAYAPINMDDHHDDHDDHSSRPYDPDAFGSLGSRPNYETETSYTPHHTSSPAPHENPFDNSYRTHGSVSPHPDPFSNAYATHTGPQIYAPPAADDYDDGRPVQFPTANYDRTLH
ncbi:hypothetical protein F5B22DRAFT_333223 [Xylaria bambusicola]|uniref:uncharacterized protein n=1 Tax=Xylaria bambusicola TaxID=326684 RepID=UPI002008E41B|nr:uncharacterized protein F5B22DRAFT_333223 [Xylaria bambusicola]KAI0525313.1 hypothetical protein F5B22DRAFT_333223 [Xylaria bambusicola]